MSPWLRPLKAEFLKLRGTLALWMCAIAPATVAGLLLLQFLLARFGRDTPPPAELWQGFCGAVLQLWAFLMLPLFITLQSALLAGLEHSNRRWTHLLALPVPRTSHYIAKFVVLVATVTAATTMLVVLCAAAGVTLGLLRPVTHLGLDVPWAYLLRGAATSGCASLLIIAIHTWASLRWRSFTVAVSIGMTATVMGFLAMQSQRYGPWFPWAMPLRALSHGGEQAPLVMMLSTCGAVLAACLGLADLARREGD